MLINETEENRYSKLGRSKSLLLLQWEINLDSKIELEMKSEKKLNNA